MTVYELFPRWGPDAEYLGPSPWHPVNAYRAVQPPAQHYATIDLNATTERIVWLHDATTQDPENRSLPTGNP